MVCQHYMFRYQHYMDTSIDMMRVPKLHAYQHYHIYQNYVYRSIILAKKNNRSRPRPNTIVKYDYYMTVKIIHYSMNTTVILVVHFRPYGAGAAVRTRKGLQQERTRGHTIKY